MNIKWHIWLLFLFFFSVLAYAEETTIEIQKVGTRTEAVVPVDDRPARIKPTDAIGKGFYAFESGIVTTARFSSSMIGKITDATVLKTQKVSGMLFSPVFKTLDVKRWSHKK